MIQTTTKFKINPTTPFSLHTEYTGLILMKSYHR
jgi:hypothetical protein